MSRVSKHILLAGLVGIPVWIGAESTPALEAHDQGKPAAVNYAALPVLSYPEVVTTLPDSSVGKPPVLYIQDGPPPRSLGPGLHFDTRRFFYIYTDYRAPANHFAPSGWMGDYGDIKVDDKSVEDPADGMTCFKFTYNALSAQGNGWAGVYWQQPENNWGFKRGGYNLAGFKRLTFWARGARGGEQIASFKVGGIAGQLPDTGVAEIGPVTLTQDWKQYMIDLSGADLTKVSGGFAWAANRHDNPLGMTFYLDEIRFER